MIGCTPVAFAFRVWTMLASHLGLVRCALLLLSLSLSPVSYTHLTLPTITKV